ncbi:TIGR04063 family PEP-CTERM/XrtA system glycosyltransferase [Sphingosinicella rhizophila]|uniref:Glycosyltransferase, exosortase A system-associated n=1 Tax=Sphingosinicella rhizophila TaxID=3050082 RepID=A0ABU3Q6Y9_9SPHN|nr:TIGR04063 family PEP-CTERM/XrtA system glycosyltransferase [Sphingosinicella sp. GR2756]MDT9599156.1 glycosyltransferase, exosortase A system-associated [Sphingosinicella sp. GR2756]
MRILHVLDHSLPLHSGYTFRTRAIVTAQKAKGLEIACLTGARHRRDGPDPEVIENIAFYRTLAPAVGPSPLREWREIRALSDRLERLVEEWRPDQLHVHSPVLNALAALPVAKRKGLPLLYEIRAFWEDAAVGNGTGSEGSPRYRLTRALETYAARQADAVAVICEGLRRDLIARNIPAAKIILAPNGVDMSLFGSPLPPDRVLAARLGLAGADVVGFIGSFYDYEGLDDLIAAMPLLHARRPNAHLLLVGGGPMEAALKAQAAASQAAGQIHFIGRVPHEQVELYYSLVDILAYPRKAMRLTELVTPLKPLEAMAQRKLVAASDVGGHRELIEDGVTGTLFPAGDPAALAEALDRLFADRGQWEQRRETARRFVERDRNWSSNISRYIPAYQKLTGKAV